MIPSRAATIPAALLLVVLTLPVAGLLVSTSPTELYDALALPSTRSALWLSLRTTTCALGIMVALGTPLAWRLSRARGALSRVATVLVELPVVLPPAVLGIALLETLGRRGVLGPLLDAVGLSLPFTSSAVVVAQVLVGAPLYVLSARSAFAAVNDDTLLVARTLGATAWRAWFTIALPAALPGLLSAAALGWARALGEFGATLMFAGSLPGRTQTLPLAIYGAMERDMAQARAISVVLVLVAVGLLVLVRLLDRGDADAR